MASICQNQKNVVKGVEATLNIIQHGLKLQIADTLVANAPFEHWTIIDGDIQNLLRKQVIEETANDTNTGYYSNLFTNRKKDGTCRTKFKFLKLESIKNVINILKADTLLALVDIKDAFYLVFIFLGHKKYLQFI